MPTVLAPTLVSRAKRGDSKLVYWKQILPYGEITAPDAFTGKPTKIRYDDEYYDDCIATFKGQKNDATMFQLANSSNSHGPVFQDFDPERTRGQILDLAKQGDLPPEVKGDLKAPGLYAKVRFFDKQTARAVRDNPKLGVSPRVREGFTRADGVFEKRRIVHVCGTIDPRINELSPWRATDLTGYDASTEHDTVIDLSSTHYPEDPVAKNPKNKVTDPAANAGGAGAGDGATTSVLERLTDEELATLMGELGITPEMLEELGDEGETDEDDEGETGTGPAGAAVVAAAGGAGAGGQTDFSVAHQAAIQAGQRADEALRQMAASAWQTQRTALVGRGIPPAMVDLTEPVFNRPGTEFVVDLSNEGGPAAVDLRDIVTKLLDGMAGYVDLAVETGHAGQFNSDQETADPDEPVLSAWDTQYPAH